MALLKLYRGLAAPAAEVGKIWFDVTNGVIKVYNGTEWEAYGLSEAEIAALILAAKNEVLGTLEEGDSATLAALNDEIDALQAELAALAAKTVTINEKATGHVTVSKTVDAQGATVYTVAENDIASAAALAKEVEDARAAEKALADRLDIVEGEATVEGSIKKALADAKAYTDEAKAAVIGDATEAGDTLGKLEDRIETIVANEKTYSIAKVTEGLGTNIKEAYKLVDEDGTQCGTLIEIEKDDSLVDVVTTTDEKGNQVVKFTYNLADGTSKEVTIDLSAYVTESEYGDGLQVVDHVISVKRDATSEAFLTVGADGVKLAGVQDAIDAAKAEAIAAIAPAIEALDADVTSVATYTVTDEKGAESTVDHKVRVQVVEVDGVVTGVNVTESDIASAAALATLDAEVQKHEVVVSAALNDLNARITNAEGSVADHEARLTQAEADIDALEGALADKNVAAESTTPDYVTATAADNKVTIAATQKVIDAVALAETSVQTITSDNTCLTAVKTGNNVALSLVWEEGSF